MAGTIPQEIQRLENNITAAYAKAQAKGATMPTVRNSNNLPSTIESISGGGGGGAVAPNDVQYLDYDGTILHSYSASDFATLAAEPELPTREGLVCQGWNYSLAKAQEYVAKYGKLFVGAMYNTDDGKTRIYIRLEEGRLEPWLGLAVNGTCVIEWGDGTTDTVTGTSTTALKNTQHTYAAAGDYVIALGVTGELAFIGTSSRGSQVLWKNGANSSENYVYQNAVQEVHVGDGVTSIRNYAFQYCYSLASITIPNGVTSIDGLAFGNCYSLASIAIPDGVTSIGSYAFRDCRSLASITIPNGVTSIGSYAFQSCCSLASVTIPDGVTSIGDLAFGNCYSLASIAIPDGVTSIGSYAFQYCYSLASVAIPDGVTSIRNYAFQNCYSLASITIPNGVTSIGSYAFQYCYGLGELHFKPTTPPAVSNSNAWTYIPTDCIIYVPTGTLEAYTTATNYPSSSTYTYMEE